MIDPTHGPRFQSRLRPTILALLTLGLFAFVLTFFPEYSGFAAGVFKFALAIGGVVAVDVFVLRGTSTYDQIVREKNIAYAIVFLGYCLIAAATVATAAPLPGDYSARGTRIDRNGQHFLTSNVAHLDAALAEVGTTEQGANCGRGPRAYLQSVGLGCGSAWCAAFTSWCLTEGRAAGPLGDNGRPIRTAGARRFITRASLDARRVLRGELRPPPGSVVTWGKGETWQGHSGLVVRDDNADVRGLDWYARCGLTVEGNTSSGNAGSQRDGDGVYRRLRCIEPGAYFRITHFTTV